MSGAERVRHVLTLAHELGIYERHTPQIRGELSIDPTLGEGALPLGRSLRAAVGTALVGLALATTATPLRAQTTSASVFGSVKDSLGGMLPGATVTLTSRTQGHTLAATSDDQGRFVFPIVRPDAYTLRVSRQGFKTAERTNVVVSANDKFSAGVVTLDVGGIEESVSVTGRVSELQTTSGERSFTLEGEAIQNIANNGRSPFGFATLVPGILQQGPSGTPPEDAAGFTVNGQRPNSNNVTIDGVANIDTGNNGGEHGHDQHRRRGGAQDPDELLPGGVRPGGRRAGPDRDQERHASPSTAPATGTAGAPTGTPTRWTNKRAAAPPPVGNGRLIEPPDASRNDFGYTIGGPDLHPGRLQRGQEEALLLLEPGVPAAKGPGRRTAEPGAHGSRAGRGLLGERRQQRQPVALHPWTTRPASPAAPSNTSGCFRYGVSSGRIPPDRLYQPGLNALGIYPTPNTTGSSGINYTSQAPTSRPVAKSCCGSTSRLRTGGASRAGTCRSRTTQEQPYGTALVRQQQPRHRGHDASRFPGGTGWSRPPASSATRRRSS